MKKGGIFIHNNKIIAKGLIISILLFNVPTDTMANVIEDYKTTTTNKDSFFQKNKFENFFNDLFNKFKRPKEVIEVNKNIVIGSVKEVTLSDGQFIPNLNGNPNGYETIRVTTIGNKKLVQQDYDNLRTSGIPKVDLSNSSSDGISNGAFVNATHLTDFKFPQGITSIGNFAFQGCIKLEGNLIIPNSVTTINEYAFYGCSGFTGDLIIPNSVTDMGNFAFYKCSGFDGSLIISNKLTSINSAVFKGCSGFIGNLIIPNSITSIGISAFEGCNGFTGELLIPDSVNLINDYAFWGCNRFTGILIIPNSVTTIGKDAFLNLNSLDKIVIKVNSDDLETNYKKNIIDNLPDTSQTVIDLSYDFDITGTWLESTNKIIGKPKIETIISNGETKEKISLHIPAAYQEGDIIVLKDDKPYKLPTINEDKKYIFDEIGTYKVNITTTLGNVSNISFTVKDPKIEEAVSKAEESLNPIDIEIARDLVNSLPESIKKDEFQNRLDVISPNIEFEVKNTTTNLDIYIKSENLLSLSLNTNSVTFEDFSGVEDNEKLNAIMLTVNSSLPYDVKAYLPVEITGSKYGEALDKEIFNIRANGELDYQTFVDTETPIILLESEDAGSNNNHGIDLKLIGNIAHKKDIYKTTVKFEVEQK